MAWGEWELAQLEEDPRIEGEDSGAWELWLRDMEELKVHNKTLSIFARG